VDLNRLEGLLAGADLPSDDEDDEDYECARCWIDFGGLLS